MHYTVPYHIFLCGLINYLQDSSWFCIPFNLAALDVDSLILAPNMILLFNEEDRHNIQISDPVLE